MSIRDMADKAVEIGIKKVDEASSTVFQDAIMIVLEFSDERSPENLKPVARDVLNELAAAAPDLAKAGREELTEIVKELWQANEDGKLELYSEMSFEQLLDDERETNDAAILAERGKRQRRQIMAKVALTAGKSAVSKLWPLLLAVL